MWRVSVAKPALRKLARVPELDAAQIWAALDEMAEDPFSGDVRKLAEGLYRRRVGNYRIFFEPHAAIRFVEVTAIELRTSTTYRKR
jgi:mRNA-degrading endonuclease RelE of RelBE toxin-antitoxin system